MYVALCLVAYIPCMLKTQRHVVNMSCMSRHVLVQDRTSSGKYAVYFHDTMFSGKYAMHLQDKNTFTTARSRRSVPFTNLNRNVLHVDREAE